MTNKEAAEILKGAIKKPNTEDGYLGQAITMAIKALEQSWTVTEFADKCRECGKNKATGKWIDRGSLSCRCSRCGRKSPEETRYCPHCGSRNGGNDDK